MYIDTHSRITMMRSICSYLNVSIYDLYYLFNNAKKIKDVDEIHSIFKKFLNDHITNVIIDEVLFFHLSRRLNNDNDCNIANNLFDLLSTENSITLFLKEHQIEFSPCNNKYLKLIYKGKEIPLDQMSKFPVKYIKKRLGYFEDYLDFCVNGFLLRDLLCYNEYKSKLIKAPEFIISLSYLLEDTSIETDYTKNSKFYCFEYLVPLKNIVFDGKDNLDSQEKLIYLLINVLDRLYKHHTSYKNINDDDNNPIIRLSDKDTMKKEYFLKKEEIS